MSHTPHQSFVCEAVLTDYILEVVKFPPPSAKMYLVHNLFDVSYPAPKFSVTAADAATDYIYSKGRLAQHLALLCNIYTHIHVCMLTL